MNLRHIGRAIAGAILLAGLSNAFAATPTIDQLLSVKSVSRPRISPDARFVMFDKTERIGKKTRTSRTSGWPTCNRDGRFS